MNRTLCGVLPEELEHWLSNAGEQSYRSDQILVWVHRYGLTNPSSMTNLPASLRERLSLDLTPVLTTVNSSEESQDGTRKLGVALSDDNIVETVLIPEEGKLTQCVSTQVGCAFRCAFCLSGSQGLERNLSAGEILAQIHLARAYYRENERLTNIVLMGSGEPLANYTETARALTLMTSPKALGMSTRRVTVSTIGLPKGIRQLGEDFGGNIGLAVSLHGPDDETRSKLLPKVRSVPIEAVMSALREYPLPKRRRITIEYVLVSGVNDSESQADSLARRLRDLRVKINLIPFNPHSASTVSSPDRSVVERFQRRLIQRGLTAIIRRERGADIGAACGQLVARITARRQ